MITYTNDINKFSQNDLEGFFVNWPNPPSNEKHYQILKQSYSFWVAIDEETSKVVGFITAISDGILSAYIPLLEVIPDYQKRGIGFNLVSKMLESFTDLYMVDLSCDLNLVDFYKKFKMRQANGMIIRNYHNQNGR